MPHLTHFGGDGPPILLLHALMGRASTWWPVAPWLTAYGRAVGFDARGHGRSPHRGGTWRTPDFVADAAAAARGFAEPTVVIGHSMGGLHALALAADHPDLVRGIVIEDTGVDLRGRTVEDWRALFDAWPVPFPSLRHVREFFGPAGDYFAECVEEREDGYHFLAPPQELFGIAQEWGERSYWDVVDRVRCPVLVVEAEHTVMPAGQQAEIARRTGGTHVVVPGSGHLVHESAESGYRGAVEAFLSALLGR
ncbi:alpha/beta hydrolase [Actinokineospora auranticolor]|uniref:Pimeloyl-ACP methyl ester carboxylesterase n=1 Tax=Actinokineospora auranticolor TaxID=155976 RepID=A0A2S6GE73_9PSEU|nr:alpha/beta hydrolase [Actinokineospora auranticolor]PPK63538.1 pimeloyl-ACP methyl ester carboxylesterase [Actinokineospora auranticolor]